MKKSPYRVWIFLLPSDGVKFYFAEHWMQVFDALTPIVSLTKGKPALRIIQSFPSGKVVNPRPLQWTVKNMEKWTHNSAITKDFSSELLFAFCSLWCPSEVECAKEQIRPQLFATLHLQSDDKGAKSHNTVDQIFCLAISENFYQENENACKALSESLNAIFKPSLYAEILTPWKFKSTGSSAIMIPTVVHFFKDDWDWSKQPSKEMFAVEGSYFELVTVRSLNLADLGQ